MQVGAGLATAIQARAAKDLFNLLGTKASLITAGVILHLRAKLSLLLTNFFFF